MRTPVFVIALSVSAMSATSFEAAGHAEPLSAASSGLTADDVAARVQAFYNQTKTFQADFRQEYLIKLHDRKQTSEGRVVFEKPGKMSWTYNQPNGNRVVSDGRLLKVYER